MKLMLMILVVFILLTLIGIGLCIPILNVYIMRELLNLDEGKEEFE